MKACYFLLFLWIQLAHTQNHFYGKLVDSITNKGIPLGHFFVQKGKGFYTDKNGNFELTVDDPSLNVKITALGYRAKNTLLYPERENTIYLKPKTEELSEVVLEYVDPAKELVRKIVKAIPENYPTEEEQLFGVIEESAYRDSLHLKPIYKAEAKIRADKISYLKKSTSGNVQLLEFQIDSVDLDTVNLRIYGSAHKAHTGDFVHRRQGPLSLKKLNVYKLKIIDTLEYDGNRVIQLEYQTKKSKGTLLVDENTFAVVKVDRIVDPNSIDSKKSIRNLQRLFFEQTSIYKKRNDQKWRIHSVHYRTGFGRKNRPQFFYLDSRLTIEKHLDQTKIIPQKDRFTYGAILSDHIISQTTDSIDLQLSEKDKLIATIQKFRAMIGASFHQILIYPHQLDFSPLSLAIENKETNQWLGVLTYNLEYKLNNKLGLSFDIASSFSKKQYQSTSLGINFFQDLSKRDRVYLFSALNIGHRVINIPHGTFDFNHPFQFGGKRFDSGNLALYTQNNEVFFNPSMGLIFRISPLLHLRFNANYFSPLSSSTSLYVKEKNEFWFWNRKKAVDKNGVQSKNSKPIQNNYSLGVNLYYRF